MVNKKAPPAHQSATTTTFDMEESKRTEKHEKSLFNSIFNMRSAVVVYTIACIGILIFNTMDFNQKRRYGCFYLVLYGNLCFLTCYIPWIWLTSLSGKQKIIGCSIVAIITISSYICGYFYCRQMFCQYLSSLAFDFFSFFSGFSIAFFSFAFVFNSAY